MSGVRRYFTKLIFPFTKYRTSLEGYPSPLLKSKSPGCDGIEGVGWARAVKETGRDADSPSQDLPRGVTRITWRHAFSARNKVLISHTCANLAAAHHHLGLSWWKIVEPPITCAKMHPDGALSICTSEYLSFVQFPNLSLEKLNISVLNTSKNDQKGHVYNK